VRRSGRGVACVECHIVLPGNRPLGEAHVIVERVERALRNELSSPAAAIHLRRSAGSGSAAPASFDHVVRDRAASG
jgi:divalent metal cation (Fe/Co/Zn/Cd) transporter